MSAGGFPKARFTLLVWQCSVWHRSLLGVTLSFPLASTLRLHHTASLGSITCCHSLPSLTGIPATVQYCSILVCSIAVLAGSFPTSGLLPATAVVRKDSRYSKAQYSRAGRLNSLGPILHRAIISNGRMQNDEPKKNGAVLFSTVYFNAVLAGAFKQGTV